MALPRHSRSGRRPACSDANSVPVRPKPVATSSQMRSTSCAAHAAPRRASPSRSASCMPAAPCTSGSTITATRSSACARHDVARDVEARRIVEGGRAQHREAQRSEHVGAEAVVAHRKRADRVAVVRAAEREEVPARRAEVRPVLERDLQRLLDGRRAVGRVEEVRLVDGNDACERLGQLDDHAVAVPEHRRVRTEVELVADRVVELGHAVTERVDPERRDRVEVAPAVDVDELVALRAVDDDRVVVRRTSTSA